MPKKWYRDISQYSVAEKYLEALLLNLRNSVDLRSYKYDIQKLLDSHIPIEQIMIRVKRNVRKFITKKYIMYRDKIVDEKDQDEYIEIGLPLIKKIIKENYLVIYKIIRRMRSENWIRKEFSVSVQSSPEEHCDIEKSSVFKNHIIVGESKTLPDAKCHAASEKLTGPKTPDTIPKLSQKVIEIICQKRQIEKPIPYQYWENKSDYRISPLLPKWYNRSDYRISHDQINILLSLWENKSNYRIAQNNFTLVPLIF